MRRRKFITAVSASAASVALAGCTGLGNGDGGANETETETESPTGTGKNVSAEDDVFDLEENQIAADDDDPLKIQNSRLLKTAGEGAGVLGDVKNTGDETYTFLKVKATLYDESDDVLGEFFDNTEDESIDDLAPGEVWDFEIWFEDADLGKAASYSLSATGETENGTATPGGNETMTGDETNNSTA